MVPKPQGTFQKAEEATAPAVGAADVEAIFREAMRGIRTLKRWSNEPGNKKSPVIHGRGFSKADVKQFAWRAREYKRTLTRVAMVNPGESRKQCAMAHALVA